MSGKSSTTTMTAKEVRRALAKTLDLSPDEERALRMKHGVAVQPAARLGRKAAPNTEAADELLVMEMELLKAHRAHLDQRERTSRRQAPQSRTKDKIVRALRKKR